MSQPVLAGTLSIVDPGRQHLLPRLTIGNEAGVGLNGAVLIGAQEAVGGGLPDIDSVNSSVYPRAVITQKD